MITKKTKFILIKKYFIPMISCFVLILSFCGNCMEVTEVGGGDKEGFIPQQFDDDDDALLAEGDAALPKEYLPPIS